MLSGSPSEELEESSGSVNQMSIGLVCLNLLVVALPFVQVRARTDTHRQTDRQTRTHTHT
eukprot:51661-Rhodomonas_salina.1